MLQWMGGSRRKVAASHTSVKKRQKQYFEQRRQQQHQLTVGSESCTNDINNSNQHSREHQSLDILNLLNLSTATPECKPSCPENGMQDLDADFYSLKDNISGVGSSFNHIAEPTSSKRTLFSLPDNQTNDFKKANTDNQTNDFKKANTTADLMDGTERKLSVFDLVGDDHTTTNLEECSPSEAHMAFSVEGLGKINTETPVNSPQPSDRTFVYRCSSPWMDNGQPNTSHVRERLNDFENEVDTIIESSKMFQDDSRYRSPIGIHAKDGGRKQKLQTFSDHLHKQYSDSRSNFCDVADFNNSRFSDDEWNGLGKINTETPVNSPQPSDRTFVYRCSSPWMDNGQPNTSHVRERLNDFENEVDTIIESSKMFQDDSRYRSPIGIHAKDGGRKQKLQTFSDHLHKQYSDSRSNFCDVADFNNSRFSDDEWNGLGKINTETPVNSPQPSDRTFVYRCSSPWMDNGQPNTSHVRERLNDFENEVDTIIESSKMFQDDSRYRSPIGIHAKDGGRKQKLQTFSDHLHKQYSDSRSNFCDVADFNNSRFSDDEWNAKSAFLGDGEDSFYWKGEQPCQKESLNPDFLKYGKDYTESRSSSEHHRKKKRDYLETTWRSNIRDSPTQRSHLLERNIDHPSFAKPATSDFDFNNVFEQPVWSSIVPEEDKDSHSLRSEESCSSSAVWTNETHNSQFETNTRQRKRETNSFRNLGDKYYLNNNLFQESWEDWDVDDQHMKRQVGSGKQVRLSNPGKLKSTSQREGGLDESYNWFAEGFSSAGINSDVTSERDKPYPFLNAEIGSSHWRSSRAPDSIPETWVPKFSVGGTGDDDDEDDYVNCLSANHKSKLAGDTCGFENDTLSENDNEQNREVNHPKIQGDETSSSVAKSLSDENECNPNKEVMQARHQVNRESGEKTSRDSLQQMIMLERRTLQLVCFNKTLLLDSLKT